MLARFNAPLLVHTVVHFAFRFLAFPFLILSWYFFIRAVLEMSGKKFRLGLRIGYLVLQAGILILWTAFSWEALKNPLPAPVFSRATENILLLFVLFNRGLVFCLWILAYVSAGRNKDPDMDAGIRRFSAAYIVMNVLYGVAAVIIKGHGFVCFTYPVLEFFMHVPPLFLLWDFLRRYAKSHPVEPVKEKVWLMFFARYQISAREQDIIRLLLEGKNAKDISRELYISIKTVKTHIYNIYRKLGIKNRWQLITMIHNYGRSAAGEA
jgi:DNA-binding CsgD family transcriptional regulator